MSHQFFGSSLFARSHTYSAEEADPLAWATRRAFDVVKPFGLDSGANLIRNALLTGHTMYSSSQAGLDYLVNNLEPGELLSHHHYWYREREMRVTEQEAVYWLALLESADFWTALKSRSNQMVAPGEPPAFQRERLHALFFPEDDFGLDARRRLVTFMAGVLLPYLELLEFLVEHELFAHVADMGPPPEACRERALALFTAPFVAHVHATKARTPLLYESVRCIPSREAVEALLTYRQGWDAFDVLDFGREDDAQLFEHFTHYADARRAREEQLAAPLLKHFLLRFGFAHMDRLERWLKRPTSKKRGWSIHYTPTLARFNAPESIVLEGWSQPPSASGSLKGSALHYAETLETCAGVLALLHERGVLKKQGAVIVKERLARFGEGERERLASLLSLCSKPVQKLLNQDFGMDDSEQRELPEPLWTPWMRRAAALVPSSDASMGVFQDRALATLFEEETATLYAGEQVQFLFPRRVLLGLFQAQRLGAWQEVTEGAFSGHHPLIDGVLYTMDLDALLSRMYARWLVHEAQTGEMCWFMPMLGACGEAKVVEQLANQAIAQRKVSQAPAASLIEAVNALREGHALHLIECYSWLKTVDDEAWRALSAPKRRIEAAFGDEPVDWRLYTRERTMLHEGGIRLLDYGTRKITMRPDTQGNARYRTPDGEVSTTMPSVSARDLRIQANASRKSAREFMKSFLIIVERNGRVIEDAMLAQRLWSVAAWTHYLVRHPVWRLSVVGLVWGIYSPARELMGTALLMSDGSLMTRAMETFTLSPEHLLTPVHRLDLSEEELAAWQQLLAEFELIQPLSQLEREVFLPGEPTDRVIHDVLRTKGLLKPHALSYESAPGFRRAVVAQELTYTFQRALSGETMTLNFGKGWDQKRMRWIEAEGTRYDATFYHTAQRLGALSPMCYSELCHFLRPRWMGPAF